MSDATPAPGEGQVPVPAVAHASRLLTLARLRWQQLTAGELLLLGAAERGAVARFKDDPREGSDPEGWTQWGDERRVRADLIRWMFADEDATACVDARGIQLRAARIEGSLDLGFLELSFPLRLWRCVTTEAVNLEFTSARTINLFGSRVAAISGSHLVVRGSLTLKHVRCEGGVDLSNARIGGTLYADGATFLGTADRQALNLEAAHIEGSVYLRREWATADDRRMGTRTGRPFETTGEVRLASCRIDDNLECHGATLSNPEGRALEGHRLVVGGNVALRGGFSCTGEFNLDGAKIDGGLHADGATLNAGGADHALSLEGAEIGASLYMRETWQRNASGRGGAFSGPPFRAAGEVRLYSCKVGHNLICRGARFSDHGRMAIRGQRLRVGGNLELAHCAVDGSVDLSTAQIGGDLRADGSTFDAGRGKGALNLWASHIEGGLSLSREWHADDDRQLGIRRGPIFRASGEVRITSAMIDRGVWCHDARFSNPGGRALAAFHVKVGGGVEIRRCTCQGGVDLMRAQILGDLNAEGSGFDAATFDRALDLYGAHIEGSALLRNERAPSPPSAAFLTSAAFLATGQARLSSCRVDGHLEFDGATFTNEGKVAIAGSWLKVGGNVNFGSGFSSRGTVQLSGMTVGGEFDCQSATFDATDATDADGNAINGDSRDALDMSFAAIGNNLRFNKCTVDAGWIRFYGVRVGADLWIQSLTLSERTSAGVNLIRSAVSGVFFWKEIEMGRSPGARLALDHAELGRLGDDASSWPAKGCLSLAGLRYGAIVMGPQGVKQRLDWLSRQRTSTFSLQPYEQLALVFRNGGQESAARRVAIARENARRRHERLKLTRWLERRAPSDGPDRAQDDAPAGMSLRAWLGSRMLRATIGYGYASGRTVILLAALVVVGALVFRSAREANACVFAPIETPAVSPAVVGTAPTSSPPAVAACDPATGYGPAKGRQTFNPIVYSIDALLPIVDLHQKSLWLPDPAVRCGATWAADCGAYVRRYLWLHTALGWMLTTLAVAGFTGLIRKS